MTQIEVEFNYEGKIINIQSKTDEKMEEIIKRFSSKIGKKKKNYISYIMVICSMKI